MIDIDKSFKEYKYYLMLVLLWGIAYYNNLHSSFFYDDYNQIVTNNNLNNIFDFTSVIFCHLRQIRVIQNITFAIDKTLGFYFNDEKIFFHITNNILHLISGLLVYRISKAFYRAKNESFHFFVASIFLLAPIQVQTVTYVMGRIGILQNIIIFLILLELSKLRDRKNWKILSFLIFSYFVKENNIILPFLVIIFDFIMQPDLFNKKNLLKFYIPALLTIAILPIANHYLIDPGGWTHQGVVGFSLYWNKLEYFLTQGFYFFFTIYLIFNPSENLIYHEHFDFNWYIGFLGLIFWLVAIILPVYLFTKKKYQNFNFFMLIYFLIFYASTNSFLQMVNPFAEYRISLYFLPIVFFIVHLVYFLSDKIKSNLTGFLVFLIFYFSIFTHLNNKLWNNEHQMWIIAYQKYPKSVIIAAEMARFHLRHGQYYKTQKIIEEATKFHIPVQFHRVLLKTVLNKLLFAQGKFDESIKLSKEIIREMEYLDLDFFKVYLAALHHQGDIKEYNRIIDIAEENLGPGLRIEAKSMIHLTKKKKYTEEHPLVLMIRKSRKSKNKNNMCIQESLY